MDGSRLHGRASLFTLAVGLCLLVGCTTPAPIPQERAVVPPVKPTTSHLVPATNPDALAHYAAGVSLEARVGAASALPEYEKAFELDPKNAALAGRLAQIYLSQKERDKALALLDRAIKANPDSPEPWFWTGVAHRTGDELPLAISDFQNALKRKGDHLPSIRALVEAYFQKDMLNEVPALLEHAFNQNSTDAPFWVGLGDLYMFVLKQKPSLASLISSRHTVECYQKARKNNPRDPEILLRLAETQMTANNYAGAADAYAMLLKLRPDLTQLRERLATAYLNADQKEKALAAYRDILKREPMRYDIHNTVAELCQDLDKDADAAVHLELSLGLNPNQFEVYVRLVLVRLRQKRLNDALQTIANARKKFPTRFQLSYLTGLVYSEQKQPAKAVAAYAEAEQLIKASDEDKPNSPFYFVYGAACERNGQFDKAVTLLKKSLELEPKNHNAANYLGYMWADKNQNLTEALDLINKALAIQPDNAAYLDSLGWVYFRLGRLDDALKQLRRSIELLKEPDATVYDHIAEVLLKLGKRDEALANLRKATEVDPENKDLAEKLKKWTAAK